jgi:hypothetical protein
MSIAPNAKSDASVITANCILKSGIIRAGASTNADLSVSELD